MFFTRLDIIDELQSNLPATQAVIKHAIFVLKYDLSIIVDTLLILPLLSTAQMPTKTTNVPRLENPQIAYVVRATAFSCSVRI